MSEFGTRQVINKATNVRYCCMLTSVLLQDLSLTTFFLQGMSGIIYYPVSRVYHSISRRPAQSHTPQVAPTTSNPYSTLEIVPGTRARSLWPGTTHRQVPPLDFDMRAAEIGCIGIKFDSIF